MDQVKIKNKTGVLKCSSFNWIRQFHGLIQKSIPQIKKTCLWLCFLIHLTKDSNSHERKNGNIYIHLFICLHNFWSTRVIFTTSYTKLQDPDVNRTEQIRTKFVQPKSIIPSACFWSTSWGTTIYAESDSLLISDDRSRENVEEVYFQVIS